MMGKGKPIGVGGEAGRGERALLSVKPSGQHTSRGFCVFNADAKIEG